MPSYGPADRFELGDWNIACSMCGRKLKASEAVKNWAGMWRHPKCNEPRQPQDFVRGVPDIQTPAFTQDESDNDIQVSVVLPIKVSPSPISVVAGILLNENGTALLNENGTALMSEAVYAQVLMEDWISEYLTSVVWSWQSGGAGILIASPNAALTELLLNGNVVAGTQYTGVLLCTVQNSIGGVGTGTCNVSITA